jgi:hypothetical protein
MTKAILGLIPGPKDNFILDNISKKVNIPNGYH